MWTMVIYKLPRSSSETVLLSILHLFIYLQCRWVNTDHKTDTLLYDCTLCVCFAAKFSVLKEVSFHVEFLCTVNFRRGSFRDTASVTTLRLVVLVWRTRQVPLE